MLPATFRAELERPPDDPYRMHTLVVPMEVATAILASGSRRVVVTVGGGMPQGTGMRRALHTRVETEGQRTHLLRLSGDTVRDLGLREGAIVAVTVGLDPDPDRLDLPDELAAALDLDPEAAARFEGFTPGRQRGLAHYVGSAKRPETREKRALELTTKLRTFTLYGDLHPEKR